ncbi:pentapeptide repeat-containing protein [Pseudanabaena sp. 'Roaring Creek']|uniref:pentapeptide repeat-containing protein n=1 Tax=Pseudanabaena sp. 'Roaring Creek' TaxID=1681830 RepID=UPI0006D772D4|nr:pentapeptide repeat-containing protein [Pseudanabaena sp. 'Roaring Creek']
MASNKNNPIKGQGVNEPDKKQSLQSDAADVDWMIISDLSTRIGGVPQQKVEPNQTNPPPSSQPSSAQTTENDLEDLEWLRSLGLDEPIERSSSQRNTSSNSYANKPQAKESDSDLGNIDWLIVTDLKTRMDEPENKPKADSANPRIDPVKTTLQPLQDINIGLDDDFGLDELDFLGNADLAELDSLGLDASDSFSLDSLQSIGNEEGKISGLAELLEDSDDSSFDLSAEGNDPDWDSISNLLEENFENIPSQPSLNIDSEYAVTDDQDLNIFGTDGDNNTEDYYANSELNLNPDLPSNQPYNDYSDEFQDDLLHNDLNLSDEFQDDLLPDNLEIPEDLSAKSPEDLLIEDLSMSNDFQDEFPSNQSIDQDPQNLFLGEGVSNPSPEIASNLDDGFGSIQSLEALDTSITEDEIWSSNPSDPIAVYASTAIDNVFDNNFDDAFTNDWGQGVAPEIDNDAVWDSSPNVAAAAISDTSINNAFGTFDDWQNLPSSDSSDLEENARFDLNAPVPNLADIDNEFAPESNLGSATSPEFQFEESFEQIDLGEQSDLSNDYLESAIENEANWNVEFANDAIGNESDWNAPVESALESALADPENQLIDSIENDADWSATLEAEIDAGNDAWQEDLVDDYLPPIEETSEIFNDALLGTVDSGFSEKSLNPYTLVQSDSMAEAVNLEVPSVAYDQFVAPLEATALDNSLDNSDQNFDRQFTDFNEFADRFDQFDQIDEDISAEFENNALSLSEPSPPPLSDWKNNNPPNNEQITDSYYADDYADDDLANYVDNVSADSFSAAIPSGQFEDYDLGNENSNEKISESLIAERANDLESMLDENFDLASFDEDSLPEIPMAEFGLGAVPTTLTPNRANSPYSEDSFTNSSAFPPPPSLNSVSVPPPVDRFEDALLSESILDSDLISGSYEVDLHEEAMANDLLNGFTSPSGVFEETVSTPTRVPSPPTNFGAPSNFNLGTGDSDFLDDFDLDSIDPTGGDFDSSFRTSSISTGLTPPMPAPKSVAPMPAPMPPNLPPLSKQEPTSPSLNNPPPPPFLPPLPPKRNPHQGVNPKPPSAANTSLPLPPTNPSRMANKKEEDDFDRFHAQPNPQSRKPINSIDESWSELLDADTVLSGGRPTTGSSYSDTSGKMSSSGGNSMGNPSYGRDRNSAHTSKRKDTNLPDFNDLGLEIHDDNTDWSGLLDSGDLSDNITTIGPQGTQMPSRSRSLPISSPRTDATGVSETREIPRDRRKPAANFGDSTQARMGTPPDQIDFNRFTEENYGAYGYEPPAPPPAHKPAPSKPKMSMPSVSLESLWQDYLKIPTIGLGAIAVVFLIYGLVNRPIFDLGLRWGLFKDAKGKDFTNADFKGAKLDNVDFSKATLTGAKMQDASLVGANFQDANLDGVNFTNANLNRARLIQSSIIWSEFKNAQMVLVDLGGSDLTRSNFIGANMEGANLKNSKIGAQGTEKATRFSPTVLLAWQIVNEPREGRNLAEQDLSGLNLSFTSLKRANLSNVKLNYTDMTNTDLSGANLTSGQVNGANWSGAKLNGINLTGVTFDKAKLPKTDEETVCPNGKKGPCSF